MSRALLIDGNSLIHRAYHALPPLTSPDGRAVGALYGLSAMMLKILSGQKFTFAAAAFDLPEPTFRKKMFAEYKAHRPPAEADLIFQLQEARKLFEVFGIKTVSLGGYEADDILGTLAKKFANEKVPTVILSGDLDTLQLVNDPLVVVETPGKKGEVVRYNEAAVVARFGVLPKLIPDYKGLVGDTSDNIPGVPGVGPKGANQILSQYQNLETILELQPKNDKVGQKILANEKSARLSKILATINQDVPVSEKIEDLVFSGVSEKNLETYFSSLGFSSLLKRLVPSQKLGEEKNPKETKNLIYIEKVEDLEKKSDHKLIASSWKLILRELLKANKKIPNNRGDLSLAVWLLNPDQPPEKSGALQNLLETEREEKILNSYIRTEQKIIEEGLLDIYKNIELPLTPILAQMENSGILVNKEKLEKLAKDLKQTIQTNELEMLRLAGEDFNPNSPAQVGELIFEKLKISQDKKKTATGQFRTDHETLEKLKNNHPLIPLLLEHRENQKVLSGFVEPLLTLQEKDGRIHTTFLQTKTGTGRLSSENPNLQNIPQESSWSTTLRNAFESAPGFSLVSLDYSQLELRLLSVISEDIGLKTAFLNGEDIHTLTASKVFNVKKDLVSKEMRRLAKTLNFGVIYGMGARAFASQSGLDPNTAKKMIEEYFEAFPSVKAWQKKTIEEAKQNGFVKNLSGRKRWFKEGPPAVWERAAINMPIQSLGADILKRATIRIADYLQQKNLWNSEVRLLLSIHDELLFEIRDDILEKTISPIKELMEQAGEGITLKAEVKIGKTWGQMEKRV
jgi:DNA polymerase-1